MTQAGGPARGYRRLETVPSQRAHQEVEETAPRALQGRVPRAEQVTVPAQRARHQKMRPQGFQPGPSREVYWGQGGATTLKW